MSSTYSTTCRIGKAAFKDALASKKLVKSVSIMKLWGQFVPAEECTKAELEYIQDVSRRFPTLPTLEQLWALLDEVWDQCGASVQKLESPEVSAFYAHPVWLINGIFSGADPVSRGHRTALADYVATLRVQPVVDFGGGYGALARLIATKMPGVSICIVDQYPSSAARALCKPYKEIRYAGELPREAGVVIAQDVLEHVSDSIGLAAKLVASTRIGGYLIFANCFEPCIKCHVPQTFHLQHTFGQLLSILGCEPRGVVAGCEHAVVFQRCRGVHRWRLSLKSFGCYSRLFAAAHAAYYASRRTVGQTLRQLGMRRAYHDKENTH